MTLNLQRQLSLPRKRTRKRAQATIDKTLEHWMAGVNPTNAKLLRVAFKEYLAANNMQVIINE